ncbi:hypothetical protein ACFE04_031711 [Oxalis oulophora]
MKYRKGDEVEVMRDSFWFPAKIVSVSSHGYVVKYSLYVDLDGKQAVEKRVTQGDVIRPVPPRDKSRKWLAGEVAEVFNGCCWREGKVSKVLKNNRYVIKLFRSILLKQFHESDLRIRKVWHHGNWLEIREVAQNKPTYTSTQPTFDDSCPKVKGRQKHLKNGHCNPNLRFPEQDISSSYIHPFKSSSKEQLISRRVKKRKSSPCAQGCDSDQCSVASCSSNDFSVYLGGNSMSLFDRISDSSDAESSFPSAAKKNPTSYGLQADVRRFELHAYKSTMQALYASGPLSWEQESLLTNLRLSLHISDDEHLLHLRRLMSAQVL